MNYVVFSAYDRKAGLYGPVFLAVNEVCGIRDFKQSLQRNPYADDMELYVIGHFENERGTLTALDKPKFVYAYVDDESEVDNG